MSQITLLGNNIHVHGSIVVGFFFQKSIPHVTWFSSFQLFICLLKYYFGIQNTENIHMIWKSIWSTLISLYQQIVSFVMYEAFRTLVLPFWSAECTVWVWCFLGHFCLSRQVFPQNTRLKVFQNFSLNQQ